MKLIKMGNGFGLKRSNQECKSGGGVALSEADKRQSSDYPIARTSSRDFEQQIERKEKEESVRLTADDLQKLFGKVEVTEDGLSLSVQISTVKVLEYLQKVIEQRKSLELWAVDVTKIAENLKTLMEASEISKNIDLKTEAMSQEKPEKNSAINITVLDPLPSGATRTLVQVLTVLLKKHGIDLVEVNIQTFNDGGSTTPVLLICNNHSRICADIRNTVAKVNSAYFHRIFLLVLHCSMKRDPPTLSTKAQVQDSEEFPGFQDILDIAFDTDLGMDGIYDCDMNTNTIQSLKKLIKS